MAKQPPPEDQVKLLSVGTLDAWVRVEHQLGMIFYVLLKPIPYPRSQSIFTAINGFQAQREAVSALAESVSTPTEILDELEGVLGRARSLATKRNRLVH